MANRVTVKFDIKTTRINRYIARKQREMDKGIKVDMAKVSRHVAKLVLEDIRVIYGD